MIFIDSEFKNSIQALCSYSFAKRKGSGTGLSIHPLVHLWARNRLEIQSELYVRKLSEVLQIINSALGEENIDSHAKLPKD